MSIIISCKDILAWERCYKELVSLHALIKMEWEDFEWAYGKNGSSAIFCLALKSSPCWPLIRKYLGDYEPDYTSTSPKINPGQIFLQQDLEILDESDKERRKLLSEWFSLFQRVILHCILPVILLAQVLQAWISIDEWPDGRRLLSTTWPWNVRVALLVLWGVCWMFIIHSAPDKDDGVEVSGYGYNANELGHEFAGSLQFMDFPGTYSGLDTSLDWDFQSSNDDYQQLAFQPIMEDEAYGNPQLFPTETIDETTGLISLGQSTCNTRLASSKSSGSPIYRSDTVQQLPQGSFSLQHVGAGMTTNESPKPSLATIARRVPNEMYCDHPDCASKPPMFSCRSNWKKHMDKHTRPYKCQKVGCEYLQGFGSKGDLVRHENTHRQKSDPSLTYFCSFTGCKRSTGIGYSREDYLKKHIRKAHGSIPRATEDHAEASIIERMSTVPELAGANVSEMRRKRRREEDDETDGANFDLGAYQHPQSEVKRLERKLADSEAQNRMLERLLFEAHKGKSSASP